MANLDFYALGEDLRELLQFIFAETDIVIYEFGSEDNSDLRQFRSVDELERVYPLGTYRSPLLQLWSPSVMTQPKERRIDMTAVPGKPYRYEPEGAGLMQLYLDGVKENVLYHSHFGHWNEAGARRGSMYDADECNWSALRRISGRIQRHIRGRLSCAKLYSSPILRHAHSALEQGLGLWCGPQVHHAGSNAIIAKPPNYAMQRSSGVVTPLAGTASGSQRFQSASGAPTARRR